MEILMSGEIYLKRGPRIIPAKSVSDRNEEKLDSIEEHFKTDPNTSTETLEQFREFRDLIRDSNTVEKKDYSGCSSFWISIITDEGIEMVEKSESGIYNDRKIFKTKEEMNKEFIRLRVFLENAKYIGQYYERMDPIEGFAFGRKTSDTSYMCSTALALYATENNMILLSKNSHTKETRFIVISPKYLEDGRYKFYGEKHEEYNDPVELYQAIFKQLSDGRRNTL